MPNPTKNVTMPRTHYNAVRRVLALLDGYLREMPDRLHGSAGGCMTTTELWEQVQAAHELMPPKRKIGRG